MSSISENKKTHFCINEATNANVYDSLEAWQNFCHKQQELGFEPSPLALKKASKQPWWQEPEITAKAA
jgi:hypothetical protein